MSGSVFRLAATERRATSSILQCYRARNDAFTNLPAILRALYTARIQPFSSTCISRNRDSPRKGKNEPEQSQRETKEIARAAASGKNSLRRVAAEAERSRGGKKRDTIKKLKADRDADAKVVTAYCAAEQYSIPAVAKALEGAGYSIDPSHTELYPQVAHIEVPPKSLAAEDESRKAGHIFVFPSGTVVAWDVDENLVTKLIFETLLPAAENSHLTRMETEDLEFNEDPSSHTSNVVGDTIDLGTGIPTTEDFDQPLSAQKHETDLALVRIAFSSGLAGSVKLAVLESQLESYFKSTRSIPAMMSKGSRLPFTRPFILRKTGELLNARAQLNLNSELTDSLPDIFWDSRHELGLEGYFDRVGRALDVNVRSRVLNQKMDYAQEIVTVLREQLSEKHGLALEWLIIILIAIEVGFEILRLWRERSESQDPESLHSLTRRYLERQLGDEKRS